MIDNMADAFVKSRIIIVWSDGQYIGTDLWVINMYYGRLDDKFILGLI